MRNVINHLNEAFQNAMSDAKRQSIDEHMTKFKCRMSCKQYMKNKPIKLGFKWWCRCCSKTGYLYEFDLYLGKMEEAELGLWETVVLDLSKQLKNPHCMLYFDNFFNSPTLIEKFFDKGIYCLGTVGSDRKNMAVMKKDKDTKRGLVDFQYADNVVAVKWLDNRGVTMVGICPEERDKISTVSRRVKGQSAKTSVPYPEIIKDYNSGMAGVDLLDQKTAAYKWYRKSSGWHYYPRLFFDLMDISVVSSHIIYNELNPKGMELLDSKIVLAKSVVGTLENHSRNTPASHLSCREVSHASVPFHLPVLQQTRGKFRYCYTGGIESKTYIKCNTYGAFLCLISGNNPRNNFDNFHIEI